MYRTQPRYRKSIHPPRAGKWQRLDERFAKTLMYWPFEDEHAEESALLAWAFILACVWVGMLASVFNLYFGLLLAVGCLYGSTLLRYLIIRLCGS